LRRVGVGCGSRARKKSKGRTGGGGVQQPLKWQAASGSTCGEGKKLGARAAARGVREGGGELRHDPGPAGVGCGR
jgi:hypothetical protein